MDINFDDLDLFGESNSQVATLEKTPAVERPAAVAKPVASRSTPRRHPLSQPVSQSVGTRLFYFDLETIPDESRLEQFDLEPIPEPAVRTTVEGMGADLPSVLLKKTLNDINDALASKAPCEEYLTALETAERAAPKPRKGVFDAIAKVRGLDDARVELIGAQRKSMSVCPEMNRIVAFGWAWGSEPPESLVVGVNATEEEILEQFWKQARDALKTIGFNILGFDIPTVCIRSILLGVKPSRQFDLKPWGIDCIDLMKVRWPNGPSKPLKWTAKAMGIDVPAGDMDGSQVEEFFKSDPDKITEYVQSDVLLVQELHQMYRGYLCQ